MVEDNSQRENENREDTPPETQEESIDLKELKDKAVNFFKGMKGKAKVSDEETMSFNFADTIQFAKKNAQWLIPLILILITIGTSTYFRMMPSYLPITDNWAENNVVSFYRGQIENQINQQFPNLPPENRNTLIEKELQNQLEQNKDQIQNDIQQLSQQLKSNLQDENGDTYLLAIDPYLWYSAARNYVNHGHLGDKKENGIATFSLRDGRNDKRANIHLNPYAGAYLYKFLHIFNRDISVMRAMFLLPVFLIGLSLIPAFFIGRKISGNIGGFFAAFFLAVNGSLLSRTPAGFADTDPYNILLPLFASWFFLEAYTAADKRWRWGFSVLAGLSVATFAVAWSGWSYIFWFIIAAGLLAIATKVIQNFIRSNYKFNLSLLKSKFVINQATILGIFVVSSTLFISWFKNFTVFRKALLGPLRFTTIKQVGVKTIWPNVLTTVAEFNTTSFSNIISQMGGKLLFYIAILGLFLTLVKQTKNSKRQYIYFFLLTIWFIGTSYAFTKGVRFALLSVPPFAIALGAAFGITHKKVSVWCSTNLNIKRVYCQILLFALLALFLITPYTTARGISVNEVPSFNDAWHGTLTKIKNDGADGIITSWWDFGHWFVAISERRVTFDGGDQGERIHWVGKSLLTPNEDEAVGIIRMLNCVQEEAPHKLDEFTDDSLKSINILKEVLPISSRTKALAKYKELGLSSEEGKIMLEYTHCKDLIPNYYITSEDMIGKAGVWGHFGSWDFTKASMYQNTYNLPTSEGVKYLTENFGLSEESATQVHSEIQTANPDRWISPWPGYISGFRACQTVGPNVHRCIASLQGGNVPMLIDLNTQNISIPGNDEIRPNSLVYPTPDGVEVVEFTGPRTGFSVVLRPTQSGYEFLLADPLQAAGTFTKLFFLHGHGMKCFSKFDDVRQVFGGRVLSWKVDFDCKQDSNVYFNEPEPVSNHSMT